jgi:hypothetical protein
MRVRGALVGGDNRRPRAADPPVPERGRRGGGPEEPTVGAGVDHLRAAGGLGLTRVNQGVQQ